MYTIHFGKVLVLSLLAWCLTSCGRGERKVDQATRDGILLLGNGGEPKALDPHLVSAVGDSNILRAMFEGLVTSHPSKDAVNQPGVAERWESNEDSSEWTFYLRRDAKWSNGDPVTAHDFVYSFHRLLHPEMGGPYASMLYFLHNGEAYNKGEQGITAADVGAEAIDDYTLRCKMSAPTPFFPDVVKHTTWLPVHRQTIEKHGGMLTQYSAWQKPGNSVSNGAFKLKAWRVAGAVKLERNPHYWDSDQVKLNGIEFYPLENQFTEERAFRNGLLHKTYIIPPNLIPRYRQDQNPNLRLEPYIGSYFFRFNLTRGTTNNVHLRRALSCAIDREAIVEYVTQAGEKPAYGFTPPTEGGYLPPNRLKFDPEAARSHLRKAGYESGREVPAFDLFINTSEAHKAIAIAVQDMWKKHLDIDTDKIKILNQEWKVYQKTIEDLEYDVARSAWIADYLDAKSFLAMFVTGDSNNRTGWSNAAYDAAIKESDQIGGREARFAKLQEAENILLDELPIVPIYWYTSKYLIHPDVKGWHPLLLDNHPYKYVELKRSE